MKKRIATLLLVTVFCLTFCSVALAEGSLSVTASVTKSRSACTVSTMTTESLYVSYSLYQVVGTTETFITSASASATDKSATASSTKALTSGTYKMYIYASGNTTDSNESKIFVI